MSYSVYFACPTCKDYRSTDHTSNCAPMWRRAGIDLVEYNDTVATNLVKPLVAAIEEMKANPEIYKAMNPENGWGDYYSALDFLERLHKNCVDNPTLLVTVDY